MADLNFKAQIELLDKMTAPMRSIASQADRLGRQFGDTAKQAKKLQSQQRLIDSFKQQKHALAETSEQAQRSRMRLADLQRQMQATTNPAASLVRQFEAAGRESQRLNTRLDSQRQHLQQLRGRLSEAGVDTRRLSDHERELARQIERTNQQLGEQRRRLGEVRRLQQQSQQMRDMRGKATGLAVGGAAATYAGTRFLGPGLQLEQNMSEVQALTRLDKSSPHYKALEAQAKQLGAIKPVTSADVAAGQAFLGMAGFTAQSIKAAIPGVLDLALAGKMDLPQTADIASNILTGMQLDTSKMTELSDVLTAAMTRGNVNISMLGETMKYAAPGAAGLGVSLEELSAMSIKLGDASMQGPMGGTALRAIMLRMAAPPKKAAEALDKLGIKVADAEGNMRPILEILAEIDAKTKDLGNIERTSILSAMSGVEASSAMGVLVGQAGNGELQKTLGLLQNSQGEAAKLADTMSDNTLGDWKEMTSGIDAFRTSVFDANSGALREFLQSITDIVQRMTAFANANPQLMAVLGKLFATLALGAVVIGSIGVVMLSILGPMALLKASLITLGLPTTLAPLSMIGAAFTKIKMVLGALKIATLINPFTIGIMLIAGLALVLINYWEPIKAFFSGLWSGIKDGLSPLKTAFEPIKTALQPLMPLFTMFKNALMSLGVPLEFSAESMSKVEAVGHALGWVLGSLVTILAQIVSTFVASGISILTATYQLWASLKSAFGTGIMTILTSVSGFVMSILTKIQSTWIALTTATSQLWTRIKNLFNGGVGSLIATLLSFSPVGLFIRVFAAVWPYLSGLAANFRQYGLNMIQGLANGITSKAQAVLNSITSVVNRIKGAFTGNKGMMIRSPSRVFFKYARFMMDGLGLGIDYFAKRPFNAMSKVTRFFTDQPVIKLKTALADIMPTPLTKAAVDIDTSAVDALGVRQLKLHATVEPEASGISKLWDTVKSLPIPATLKRFMAQRSPINFDTINGTGRYIKPLTNSNAHITTQQPINLDRRRSILPSTRPPSARSANSAAMSMGGVTINVSGAADPHTTAQLVRREMERLQRDNAARYRSRLSDID